MSSEIAVVLKWQSKSMQERMASYLTEAGIDPQRVSFYSVMPTDWAFEKNPTTADVKERRLPLAAQLEGHTHVIALGNEALLATTGRSGINTYKAKALPHAVLPSVVVWGTQSPSAVERNPGQREGFLADLRAARRGIDGETIAGALPTPEQYRIVELEADLRDCIKDIKNADVIAFDVESKSFNELEEGSFLVSLAVTTKDKKGRKKCWAIPLYDFVRRIPYADALDWLRPIVKVMRKVRIRIAHNAKFDCRWLVHFIDGGCPANWDTMLAAHLLNENRSKGLKNLAQSVLGAEPWDIDINAASAKKIPWYDTVDAQDLLWYNALDTWHTMRLYEVFLGQLEEQPNLLRIFQVLSMPASQTLVHVERRGVWIDAEALAVNATLCRETLEGIDHKLHQHLPKDESTWLYDNPNWNPSNFLRWFLFEHLNLPVIARTETGMPSVSDDTLARLKDEHPAVELLLNRVSWNKMQSSFFNPYQELITDEGRLHTVFNITGTVTGRLSSGKADADKVTGSKAATLRGVNLQQVPRDKLVRGLFGAPPGSLWLEADYSQIELRLAAHIANESTMLRLYLSGEDIHRAMAVRMTGKPPHLITYEERTAAKAVNFGFLYGMGWETFITHAFDDYGLTVTESAARAFRDAFFNEFPGLVVWHRRQRALVKKYKRVESPMGRVRHLPDIDSPDRKVRGNAERQAINSPVQAMASDLCLLSMNLLDRKFRKAGLNSAPIGTVHDAINFEIAPGEEGIVIPMVKGVMENPPLETLFGVSLKVPLVADLKVGTRWGQGQEVEFKDDGSFSYA